MTDSGSFAPNRATKHSAAIVPSAQTIRWMIGIRLVIISTFVLGAMMIQVASRRILPLQGLYILVLVAYVLSLLYAVIHLLRLDLKSQAVLQLLGDTAVVTGFVYVTGGLYSPFTFLYLGVVAVATVMIHRGGLIFAGLSAVAYGVMVDLMAFGFLPVPPNLVGTQIVVPSRRVLFQLFLNVVAFIVVAILVSYLSESMMRMQRNLEAERRHRQQLSALTAHVVRSVESGIVAVDPDGRVLHVNPACLRIVGLYPETDVGGRSIDELLPLESTQWGLVLSRADTKSIVRFEDHIPGTDVELGLTVGPLIDEHGRQAGFVINFQNLSEARREAEALRVQERMAATGEMAARMAHEIRNPLASISGSAQMLVASGADRRYDEKLVDIVVRESKRLSRIFEDFLSFARSDRATLAECNIEQIVDDCCQLLKHSPDTGSGQTIHVDIDPEVTIVAEESKIRQIVWNLAQNALQAMPEGGVLTVTGRAEDGRVVLRFTDTGSGIDEEVRESAFEPFVTTRAGGSGLGLAIVYTNVTQLGGTVDIENRPEGGTMVTVTLPTQPETDDGP